MMKSLQVLQTYGGAPLTIVQSSGVCRETANFCKPCRNLCLAERPSNFVEKETLYENKVL